MRIDPGRLASPWWRRGPLIDRDANCVAHVYWRNGALVDAMGNSWTMNGTVPQVAGRGHIPPGAGPFSNVNNYSLGAGADALDFAAGPFSVVGIGIVTGESTVLAPFLSTTDNVSTGYRLGLRTGTRVGRFSAFTDVNTANAFALNTPIVMCGGFNGGTSYAKLNLGTLASGATTYTQDAATPSRIGNGVGGWVFDGTILEIYVTTSAPSDALFAPLVARAFNRMKRSP